MPAAGLVAAAAAVVPAASGGLWLLLAAGLVFVVAPVVLAVPAHVHLRKVDLAAELQILSFHETRKAAEALAEARR